MDYRQLQEQVIDSARCTTAADVRDWSQDRKASALWWILPAFGFWCAFVAWAVL